MDQPETPQEPTPGPAPIPEPPPPQPPPEPAPKVELPDPKGAMPIPDHFRLPFRGKTATPTAVPSAADRLYNLSFIQKRRRRRGFLLGLLFGQFLIIGLDLGGQWFLHTHKNVKIQANIGVPSIVFLGMAAGAAIMIVGVALIYFVMGLRGIFRKRIVAAAGGGIKRVFLTTLALSVSIGVVIGTAWFMIPYTEWKPTVDFAKERGVQALHASKAKVRSMFMSVPRAQ